jgi:Cu/Ag efflux pump CusA
MVKFAAKFASNLAAFALAADQVGPRVRTFTTTGGDSAFMLRWIVGASAGNRVLVALAAAALLVLGAGQLRTARVDLLPEFGPSYMEVQTEALGLSAAEVEDLITIPLEEGLLSGLPWVASMRSESVPGLSSIVLVLESGADPIRGRQMVQERLTQARVLPNVSKPPAMVEPRSSTNRAVMIGLSSKDLSLIDLGVLARWTIRPRLMGVPGVSNVAIWGQRERQVAVQVDPQRLREKVVTLDQVIETTGNALWVSPLSFLEASSPGAGRFIDTANQRLTIQHLLSIKKPNDLAQVRIEGCTGGFPTARRHVDSNCPEAPAPREPLRVGDVARVVEDHQPLIGDALVNDSTGLVLVVEKLPWATTPDVTRGVETALNDLRPGLTGVEIDTIFRPATFIEMARTNVALASLLGGLLLALVLVAFFFGGAGLPSAW